MATRNIMTKEEPLLYKKSRPVKRSDQVPGRQVQYDKSFPRKKKKVCLIIIAWLFLRINKRRDCYGL